MNSTLLFLIGLGMNKGGSRQIFTSDVNSATGSSIHLLPFARQKNALSHSRDPECEIR